MAGIRNAYADEICWRAGLYPFRRRASLTAGDVARLHSAVHGVLADAIETLRTRVGDSIDVQVRDFLMVHGKAGQPCPRCGTSVSEVRQARRATHFCRHCQPGLLVGNGGAGTSCAASQPARQTPGRSYSPGLRMRRGHRPDATGAGKTFYVGLENCVPRRRESQGLRPVHKSVLSPQARTPLVSRRNWRS